MQGRSSALSESSGSSSSLAPGTRKRGRHEGISGPEEHNEGYSRDQGYPREPRAKPSGDRCGVNNKLNNRDGNFGVDTLHQGEESLNNIPTSQKFSSWHHNKSSIGLNAPTAYDSAEFGNAQAAGNLGLESEMYPFAMSAGAGEGRYPEQGHQKLQADVWPAERSADEHASSYVSSGNSSTVVGTHEEEDEADDIGREVGELRVRNEQLLREREAFLERIRNLEAAMRKGLESDASLQADLQENNNLREQVGAHREFMQRFMKMLNQPPSENSARRKIYEEGAESATNILLSMLAESQQQGWTPTKMAKGFRPVDPSFELRYTESAQLFGSEVGGKRFQLRVDYSFDGLSIEEVIDHVRIVLCTQHGKDWYTKIGSDSRKRVQIRELPNESSTENVQLYHHLKRYAPPEKDRDVVFLYHVRKSTMTRSTLAPPMHEVKKRDEEHPGEFVFERPALCQPRKRGRPLGSKASKNRSWTFGETDVHLVVRMSTSLLAGASRSEDAKRITSPVIHGALVFSDETVTEDGETSNDGSTRTRMVFLGSVPQEFLEEEEFGSRESMVGPDEVLTKPFSAYLSDFLLSAMAGKPGDPPPRPNVSKRKASRK